MNDYEYGPEDRMSPDEIDEKYGPVIGETIVENTNHLHVESVQLVGRGGRVLAVVPVGKVLRAGDVLALTIDNPDAVSE